MITLPARIFSASRRAPVVALPNTLALSANGQFVAFASDASDLVVGDTNGYSDIFVHDRQANTTQRVSLAWDGLQADQGCYAPAISADGRFVAFHSWASNLVSGDINATGDVFGRIRVLRIGVRGADALRRVDWILVRRQDGIKTAAGRRSGRAR